MRASDPKNKSHIGEETVGYPEYGSASSTSSNVSMLDRVNFHDKILAADRLALMKVCVTFGERDTGSSPWRRGGVHGMTSQVGRLP